MKSTSVLRGLAIVAAAFILGSAWGRLCDWLWPDLAIRLAAEVSGGIFFGLFVSLRTRRWWQRPSTTTRMWTL